MKVVSSYGVEIKKQNIPIRHTLYIYRQAVGYLIRVYEESWEELSRIVNLQKRFNAAEHLFIAQRKTGRDMTLTRIFQRCHLISADQQFSMRWEACLHMRQDWNCGNKRNWPVSQSLYMKIMQCRYSTGM